MTPIDVDNLTPAALDYILEKALEQGLAIEFCDTHQTDARTGAYAKQYSEDEELVLEYGDDPCILMIRVPHRHWQIDASDWIDRQCPDGGKCHHRCRRDDPCWRTQNAAPLSAVADTWEEIDVE